VLNGVRYLNQRRDKNILTQRVGTRARYARVIGKNRSYSTWLHGKNPIRCNGALVRGFIYRRINLDSCNISVSFFSLSLSLSLSPNVLVDDVIPRRVAFPARTIFFFFLAGKSGGEDAPHIAHKFRTLRHKKSVGVSVHYIAITVTRRACHAFLSVLLLGGKYIRFTFFFSERD